MRHPNISQYNRDINKHEAGLKDTTDDIVDIAESTSLKGMNSTMAEIMQLESQVVTKLLHNSESWIGVTEEHIQRLQEIRRVITERNGTPNASKDYTGK